MMKRTLSFALAMGIFLHDAAIVAAERKAASAGVSSQTFQPPLKQMTDEQMRQLRLQAGFTVNMFAKGLGNARMLLTGPDGGVYVTRTQDGKVTLLRDKNADGVSDEQKDVVPDLKEVHGIAIHENQLYLATTRQMYRGQLAGDGSVQKLEKIGPELPDGGGHPKRTIGFGPQDGMLYISVGSTCNNCEESNPEHATMLRAKPDATERRIFASGLRNTIGFAWHPQTRELWGMDHGSDHRGNDLPPEELNRIVEGADYGWPFCYGNKVVDPLASNPRKGGSKEERCEKSVPPVLTYQAHSAPIGMMFYTGQQFPREYHNNAFVAMRGSWNRKPATGYKVVRVRFDNGKPTAFEDFLSGFLSQDGQAQFGRLAGLAVAKDGALLVSDDANGVIYRVSYKGGAAN